MICHLSFLQGSGSYILGGDGEGEDGLSESSAEVHHYLIWQTEYEQLP